MSDAECKSDFCTAPWFSALYPQGEFEGIEVVRSSCKEDLRDAPARLKNRWGIHVVFEERGRVARALHLAETMRFFSRAGLTCQVVGLAGAVERPHLVAPMKHPILRYVDSVAFRGTDSPARAFLKRLVGLLPMPLVWQGPLVLVAAKSLEPFDRFVLLTKDREITFLFHESEATPWAVTKSGACDELIAEHRKHCRAVEILGRRVPALLGVTEHGTTASITLEAIRERFLGNVVASALWGREKIFIREALEHLDFCCEIYRLVADKGGMDQHVVSANDINGLVEGIDGLLSDADDASLLKEALSQTIGAALPKLMQHGDFCVRNILIAGGDRGRVLIDWEDLQERRWPLVDYVLLRLSLKEVYADLFNEDLESMEGLAPIADGLAAVETELMNILNLEPDTMWSAQLLSLACLCRQNLTKGRKATAMAIFGELKACARSNPGASEARVLY